MIALTAILVDDEANNRENLRLALQQFCKEVQVVGEADSAISAMDLIAEQQPDLVFLDIAMPQGSGFELLESLPEINFDIIFVTAFDQYAIRAIRFCAIDYLLKPIDSLELKNAVNRVIQNRRKLQQAKKMEVLLDNRRKKEKKLALPQSDHIEFVEVADIVRCQGDRNYTHFYLRDGRRLLVSRTLKEYAEILEGQSFFRIHQSHLVNLDCIRKYSKRDGGTLTTTDGKELPVARARKERLLALIMDR